MQKHLAGLMSFNGVLGTPQEVTNIYKVKWRKMGLKTYQDIPLRIYICPHCRKPFIAHDMMALESCPECHKSLLPQGDRIINGQDIRTITLPLILSELPESLAVKALAIYIYGYKAYRLATFLSAFHVTKTQDLPKHITELYCEKVKQYCGEDETAFATIESNLFDNFDTSEDRLIQMYDYIEAHVSDINLYSPMYTYGSYVLSYSPYKSYSAKYLVINLDACANSYTKSYKVKYTASCEVNEYFRLLAITSMSSGEEFMDAIAGEEVALFNSKTGATIRIPQNFIYDKKSAEDILKFIKF